MKLSLDITKQLFTEFKISYAILLSITGTLWSHLFMKIFCCNLKMLALMHCRVDGYLKPPLFKMVVVGKIAISNEFIRF